MSSKTISMIKNSSAVDKKTISAIAQFYMKLPEAVNYAIENLSRDEKRRIKKEKQIEKKIIMALDRSAVKFTEEIYNSYHSAMIFSCDASYEEVMASYNDENCIMNTIFIFKKIYDGSFDKKKMLEFLRSEQFNKALAYDFNENQESEKVVAVERHEENQEYLWESNTIKDFSDWEDTVQAVEEENYTPDISIDNKPVINDTSEILTAEDPVLIEESAEVPKVKEEQSKAVNSKKKAKEKKITYYIGYIERRETYYNFAPQYKIEKSSSKKELIELRQVAEKFPPNGTINLSYIRNSYSQSQKIIEKLDLKNTFAISFEESAIEENINSSTNEMHNDVNYKIDLQKEFDINRNSTTFFKKISELRAFRIAESKEFVDDNKFVRDYIQIDDEFASGELVLLRRRKEDDNSNCNDISGPYKVDKREGKTFIQPKIEKQNYLINCYNEDKLSFGMSERQEFGCDPVCIPFALINDGCNYKKDIISDEVLIKSMFSETSKDFVNVLRKQPNEFVELMSKSQIISKNIPDEIKYARLERIRNIFSDIKNYTAEQKSIAETYLRAYCDFPEIRESLSEIIKSSQEFSNLQKELEKKYKAKPTKAEAKALAVESAKVKALAEKTSEVEELENKIAVLKEQYSKYSKYNEIIKDIEYQEGIRTFLLDENSKLKHKNNEIKGKIKSTINEQLNETKIAFDPYISNAMLESASQFNRQNEMIIYNNAVSEIIQQSQKCRHMDKKKLCDYLVSYVKKYRNYNTNDIINMYICITQGFLTVFSGLPGIGKTSVCNIIGNSLGLTDFGNGEINYNRFVPVSVEKGWTSKKDLIGYYNPLTQKYDKNNRRLYDSLMILNEEKDNSPFPYIVLLDEANLSPIEYYWADFMKIADKCDNSESYINIGLENDIYIPDTLRFVATINNDQTTEKLSPRLLDRAWIIKLPDSDIKEDIPVPAEKILWEDLYNTFGKVSEIKIRNQSLLEQIFRNFQNFGMAVSPRIKISMYNYIATARELMEGDDSEIIAIDYTVMQRLLPKINGHIKLYKEFFDSLINICNSSHLDMTKKALEQMKNNSSRNMGYCQYLS